ncbi:MAG: hypothetical protein R6U21_04765 [Thermoplasmatota archaeon]
MTRAYQVLTGSVVYAAVFNALIVGFYSLFSLSMPGMTQFFNIDYFFLIGGLVLVSVFSYLLVSVGSDETSARCSSVTGYVIIGFCLFPSLFLLIMFYLVPLILRRFSPFPSGNLVCFLFPLVLISIGLLIAIRSFKALKQCGKPVIDHRYKLKKWGLFVGVVFFVIGIVMTGVTLSFGMIGKTKMSYEIRLTTTEPTIFYIPIPVDSQTENYLSFINMLSIGSGNASWNITETSHGIALEVQTNSSCYFIAQNPVDLMGRTQWNNLCESSRLSLKENLGDDYGYSVMMFSSVNNTTVDISFSLDSGLGSWLDHETGDTLLTNGWQLIEVDKSRITI